MTQQAGPWPAWRHFSPSCFFSNPRLSEHNLASEVMEGNSVCSHPWLLSFCKAAAGKDVGAEDTTVVGGVKKVDGSMAESILNTWPWLWNEWVEQQSWQEWGTQSWRREAVSGHKCNPPENSQHISAKQESTHQSVKFIG